MTWSLRRRLIIPVVAISAAGLLVMAVALYVVTRRSAWQQRDRGLASRARMLVANAEREDDRYELKMPRQLPGESPFYVEAWNPDGTVLARSPATSGADLPRDFARAAGVAYADLTLPDGRSGRAIALHFAAVDESGARSPPLLLVLAEGTEPVDAELVLLRRLFVLVGGLLVLIIAGVGTWVLTHSTRPLMRLGSEISRIDDCRLSARLSREGLPAELDVLVAKLNELLARLEVSFARERELTADISHELRTPLAGLRTLLEVTALGTRAPTEYRAAIADALAVVAQMTAMIENLLALARLESGETAIADEELALRDLVEECWSSHAELAGRRGLEFRDQVAPTARVRSDREKLKIVVNNLLANAAEYTEPGGWIAVTHGDDLLAVTDSGPAIPREQLDRVFDRMWRGDGARSGNGAHSGIGLALSRSICARLSLQLTADVARDGCVSFRIARATGPGRSATRSIAAR